MHGTWMGDTSPSTIGVRSGNDCNGIMAMSIKEETGCGETTYASELEGLLGELHASGISTVAGQK
jgi:hypothetical protein